MARYLPSPATFYALLSIITSVVVALLVAANAKVMHYVVTGLSVLCLSLLFHLLMSLGRRPALQPPQGSAVKTAGSWNGLFRSELGSPALPPLNELIAMAGGDVFILGGTLKSFTDEDDNLQALRRLKDHGVQIRILLLNPTSDACRQRMRDRSNAGRVPTNQGEEIRTSIARIANSLGIDLSSRQQTAAVLRWYDAIPHCAVYKLGARYLVNTYVFGRGGGSPAVSFERDRTSEAYCAGLDSGFNTLWNVSPPASEPRGQ